MNNPGRGEEETSRKIKGTRLPYLRAIRRSRYLTQEQLSEFSRVARTSIYRLEGGERGAHCRTMWKLARALGVSLEELVHGERHTWWRYL